MKPPISSVLLAHYSPYNPRGPRLRRRARRPGFRSGPRTTSDTAVFRYSTPGMPWARIGEFIGQRNLSMTADTYTHVLVDEAELDYAGLLV